MRALTRFFAVCGLYRLGVASCAPLAGRAPHARWVFGVLLYLGFGAVLCPHLTLGSPKAGPFEAHFGFGAFLWTHVLTGFSEYIPNEDWPCKLLSVSLNLSEWVCVCGSAVKGFFALIH